MPAPSAGRRTGATVSLPVLFGTLSLRQSPEPISPPGGLREISLSAHIVATQPTSITRRRRSSRVIASSHVQTSCHDTGHERVCLSETSDTQGLPRLGVTGQRSRMGAAHGEAPAGGRRSQNEGQDDRSMPTLECGRTLDVLRQRGTWSKASCLIESPQ